MRAASDPARSSPNFRATAAGKASEGCRCWAASRRVSASFSRPPRAIRAALSRAVLAWTAPNREVPPRRVVDPAPRAWVVHGQLRRAPVLLAHPARCEPLDPVAVTLRVHTSERDPLLASHQQHGSPFSWETSYPAGGTGNGVEHARQD